MNNSDILFNLIVFDGHKGYCHPSRRIVNVQTVHGFTDLCADIYLATCHEPV